MHMGLFYYGIVFFSILIFSIVFMKYKWNDEIFDMFSSDEGGEKVE